MREIKFRGKIINTNEWVKGYLVDSLVIKTKEDRVTSMVDGHTIGQYIGLKDKNGTMIYEDDIISGTMLFDAFRYVVQWDNANSSYVFKSLTSPCGFLYISDFSEVEVIGNIFDNPELLNKESLL